MLPILLLHENHLYQMPSEKESNYYTVFRILIFHTDTFTKCFTTVYTCVFLLNVHIRSFSVQSSF